MTDGGGDWGYFQNHIFSREVRSAMCCFIGKSGQRKRLSVGLFALKEVETSHVLLQRFNAKSIAVLGVESSFLFDRCGCVLPFSPILWGTEAVPL